MPGTADTRPMRLSALSLVLLAAVLTGSRDSGPGTADSFTLRGLQSGSRVARESCAWPDSSIWVEVDGRGECIRYFAAGLGAAGGPVHVWFHGDRLSVRPPGGAGLPLPNKGYTSRTPGVLYDQAQSVFAKHGLPYIGLSRPGVYGSTGDHKQRRRPREIAVVNAAIDGLKAKYAIRSFILSGQSGGGHVTAGLLSLRNDIDCAVITSGVVAVRLRIGLRGWPHDATGYDDYFDPIDHIGDIPANPERRIFLIGDPDDTNVPFSTQQAYFEALIRAGHQAWLIRAEGAHGKDHSLAHVGFEVARWCAEGLPADEIVARVDAE